MDSANSILRSIDGLLQANPSPLRAFFRLLEREEAALKRRAVRIDKMREKLEKIKDSSADPESFKKLKGDAFVTPAPKGGSSSRQAEPSVRSTAEYKILAAEARRSLDDFYQSTVRILLIRNAIYLGGEQAVGKVDLCGGVAHASESSFSSQLSGVSQELRRTMVVFFYALDAKLNSLEDISKSQYAAVHAIRRDLLSIL